MSFPIIVLRIKVDLRRRTIEEFVRSIIYDDDVTHMETQFEIETMNAVPTPRFAVGAKLLAAQLL
jgi:hypothetical protein